MNINGRFRATTQILLQLIACHGVLGRVLGDFEGAEVVLDFQLEGSAVGVCGVALPVIFGYSPRVQALPVSPELELARFGDFPGAVDNFELRLGYFYAVSGGTGDVPLAAPAFEVISDANDSLDVFHKRPGLERRSDLERCGLARPDFEVGKRTGPGLGHLKIPAVSGGVRFG